MCENLNQLLGVTFDGTVWWNKDLYIQTRSKNEWVRLQKDENVDLKKACVV